MLSLGGDDFAIMYLEANEKRPATTYWDRPFRQKAVLELWYHIVNQGFKLMDFVSVIEISDFEFIWYLVLVIWNLPKSI